MNKIVAGDRDEYDMFGSAVAISGDYAIIRGSNNDNPDFPDLTPGAAYIFKRNGSSWTQIVKLTSPSPQVNGGFALDAVSISGEYAIVGAQYEDLAGTPATEDVGAAYIYKKDQGGTDNWGLTATLTVPSSLPEAYTLYGSAVAISGNYAIVGARGDGFDVDGQNLMADAGAAYVYERNTSTDAWEFQRKITASTRQAQASFGNAVAIEGDYAVVGAPGEESEPTQPAGAAYIFGKNNSNWGLVTKLTPTDRLSNGEFGRSVSIDGDLVAIGAPGENISRGGAYIFQQDNTDPDTWPQAKRIINAVAGELDIFGVSVSISGNNLIVGAALNANDETEGNTKIGAGAAYIFNKNHLTADSWGQVKKLVASDRAEDDNFGMAVAISGNYAIISSPTDSEDANGNNTLLAAGSSYIFGNLTALPVTLTNFEVTKEENSASITWNTTSETNTDYFEVQKSADARNWKVIGRIEAAGKSSQSITYSLIDPTPFKGQNLYRLKMVDLDGTFSFSRIKSAVFDNVASDFIYPNPVSDRIFISSDPEKVVSVQLINLSGKVVWKESKLSSAGASLRHLESGLYAVKITKTDGRVQIGKLILTK